MPNARFDSLREAVRQSPDNIPLLLVFAEACIEEWSFIEGINTFEAVLNLDPGNQNARVGIAHILFKMGKVSESIVRLESLLDNKVLSAEGCCCIAAPLLPQAIKNGHPSIISGSFRWIQH